MRRQRILYAVLASAAVIASAGPARAQAACDPREESGGPIKGTVPSGLMGGALEQVSQTYSAASVAQRQVLPVLAHHEGFFVRYEIGDTFGVLRAPMCVSGRVEMGKVDLSGGAFAFGYRTGPLGLYFVGSGAAETIGTPLNTRIGWAFLGIGMAQFSPAAFYKRRWTKSDGSLSVNLDAMAGAQLATDFGSLDVAYLASKGLYTNVSAKPVTAFAGAVLRTQKDEVEQQATAQAGALLDQIPYVRLGFLTLDWIVGEATDAIGTTSLYARRLRYPSIPRSSLPYDEAARQASAVATPFTTTHLEQFGIGGLVDLSVAAAWQPEAFLHEATVGIRLGNPLPQDVALAKQGEDENSSSKENSGVRFLLGVVKVPTRWFYGVDGGYRLRVGVEASAGAGVGYGTVRIGVNSPETLSLYPYANNAGELYIAGLYAM